MKVLIVSNFYYPNVVGGAEKVAQNLAEGLIARNHEAVVATLNPQKGLETVGINGVRVYYLPQKNFYPLLAQNIRPVMKGLWHAMDTYNPFMAASLRHILDVEHPDVVNTHNIAGFSSSIWRAVKKHQLPLVHTAHDYYLLCPRSSMLRNGKNCYDSCADCQMFSWPRRQASRFVDVATADSRYTLDAHLRRGYFVSAEAMPVYNCCEPASQNLGPASDGNRPLRFGFLGRLHPIKGVDLLIRSFLELPSGQAELILAGRGTPDYERQLKAMTADRPEVCFLGFVSPEVLLRQVDVLVVPSFWNDSAPVAILDSLAYGVPLIGSRLGGIPELIDEGTGWLFDPGAPGALTQLLRNAIASRCQLVAMRERARERARLFSTEVMVNGYLQAFNHAIEKTAERTVSNALCGLRQP